MRTPHTKSLTSRFIEAMHQLISEQKQKGGKIKSYAAFAESIKQSPQNFNKIAKGKQDVSAQIIEASCRVHEINPMFLILGQGEMFLSDDRLNKLESRVSKLERLIKTK